MQYLKAFGAVAALGATGVVLLKLLLMAAAPLFGMLIGLVGMALKIGLFAAVAFFLYRMFRRRRDEMAA